MQEFIEAHPYIAFSLSIGIGDVVEIVTECQNCITKEALLETSQVCIKAIADRNAFIPDVVISLALSDHADQVQALQQTLMG